MFGKKPKPELTPTFITEPWPLPRDLVKVVDGNRYRVATSTLLAERNAFLSHEWLLRTAKGNYFVLVKGALGHYVVIGIKKPSTAKTMYEDFLVKHVEWEDAFPGEAVEDA